MSNIPIATPSGYVSPNIPINHPILTRQHRLRPLIASNSTQQTGLQNVLNEISQSPAGSQTENLNLLSDLLRRRGFTYSDDEKDNN